MHLFLGFIISLSTVYSYPQSIIESPDISSPDIVSLNPTSSNAKTSDLDTLPPDLPNISDSIIIADLVDDLSTGVVKPIDRASSKMADYLEHLQRRPIKCYGKYIKQLCCWGEADFGQMGVDSAHAVGQLQYKSIGNCGPCRTAALFFSNPLDLYWRLVRADHLLEIRCFTERNFKCCVNFDVCALSRWINALAHFWNLQRETGRHPGTGYQCVDG